MERYRTTLILVILFAVLVVLFLFVNRGGTSTSNNGTPAAGTATPTVYVWQDDNQVVGIDVVSGTAKTSVRQDITSTVWTVVAPVQKDADDQPSNVAPQLQNLQATRAITPSGNLADYGLDKNTLNVTVTFSDTQHTQRTIQVGHANPDGSAYYVKPPGSSQIYLVTNSTIEPLRNWITTPPVAPPTPTPAPTSTPTVTPTRAPEGPPAPTPAPAGSQPISGTLPITNTGTSGINPTTPQVTVLPVVPTASP